MSHAGMWELPGGKVHEGEDPREALRRELREEFGVEAIAGDAYGQCEHSYESFRVRLSAYHCTLKGEIVCTEHEQARWVSPSEAVGLEWTAADLPLVTRWAEGR